MAKGSRSKRVKMLGTQRRDRVAAWQEEADAKRYASLAALSAAPRPPPPGAMAVEAAADSAAAAAASSAAGEQARGRSGRATARREAMEVDMPPRQKERKQPGEAPGVAGGGSRAAKKKAAALASIGKRRPKQHSVLMEALGGWKVKKGFKARRKGHQAPPTKHLPTAA